MQNAPIRKSNKLTNMENAVYFPFMTFWSERGSKRAFARTNTVKSPTSHGSIRTYKSKVIDIRRIYIRYANGLMPVY